MTGNDKDKLLRKFMNDALTDLDKALAEFEKGLVKQIREQLVFDVQGGKIEYNSRNFNLSNEISNRIDEYLKPLNGMFKEVAKKMLESADLTGQYYSAISEQPITQTDIYSKLEAIGASIGLDMNNNIIKGSYLDNLTRAANQDIKNKVVNYVNQSISGQATLRDFQKGFKDLLLGGKGIDTSLVRYSKQYVHDAMFNVNAKIAEAYANRLGLKYFVYEGDVIETTRPFCEERAGNTYHVDDVKTWPQALPYFQENYDFFIHRGGHNCRHNIKYISERQAKRNGYDITKHKTK